MTRDSILTLFLEVLELYAQSERTVISEYSTSITSDLAALDAEINEYKARMEALQPKEVED